MTTRCWILGILTITALHACSPVKRLGLEKKIKETENALQDHIGFMLYDLDERKVVFEHQADRYFTPASNTKILTLYTCLRTIGDSIPALRYYASKDSLIFWGTGDPSLFYKYSYNSPRVFDFLRRASQPLYFSSENFFGSHFGRGWAWDDYNDIYSSERSAFPLYGNFFTVVRTGSLVKVHPTYFDQFISVGEREQKERAVRHPATNEVQIHPGTVTKRSATWEIPMKVTDEVVIRLLQDTLQRKIAHVAASRRPAASILYSVPADSLYKVMMQESDNFIAEQLLLICSGIVRDSLKTETAIRYSLENYLNDLPDKPLWVDGSGLSRYNLITPRSVVHLWRKIYEARPRERLFPLLATGGKNGTVKNWYKAEQPYIFGKTGTLSNNHSLSGFLVTRSGKTLIFAYMNNNYVRSTSEVRRHMQDVLYNIYQKY